MKHKTSLLFLAAMLLFLVSCRNEPSHVSKIHNGVVIPIDNVALKVQFYSPQTVRIQKWLQEGSDAKKSLIVVADTSLDIEFDVYESSKVLSLASSHLRIDVDKNTGNVSFMSNDSGDVLLREAGCNFSPIVYNTDSAYTVTQSFTLSADESIYGLGQHQNGYVDLRGKSVLLTQANTEASVPVYTSSKGYLITIDNYSKIVFDDDSTSLQSFTCDVADNIDYYFSYGGGNIDGAIAEYRQLTGVAPMYGRWAYGYWQSKEHYETQAEVLSVARKYRQLHIPIDNIVQDWDYWNGHPNWGSMEFHPALFPSPKAMVDELHNMNFHIMLSIWPAVGPNTDIYKEMSAHAGYLYPSVGWAGFKYVDIYNPEVRQMYWNYLNKGLVSTGIDAWWMDSTEPDVINAVTKESSEYELKKMADNHLGTFARYLNPFSLVMVGNVYDHWRAEQPERRAYILTRSAFAGQQRYAATTWSGDIGASWEVYRKQIAAGISIGMSGVPYWTFDIGGFVLSSYDGVFCRSTTDPAYQELYTRMFQFGAMCPIFRAHGSETPREIWEFGEFTPILIKYDKLRYRLLSYIYTMAWRVTNQGYTMMRNLVMDFPHDAKARNIDDEYMFGESFLVCPVTKYQKYSPPIKSCDIPADVFRTNDGRQGLRALYCTDDNHQKLALDTIVPGIDEFWFTGRPSYATDSMYSIRYEGVLFPPETGEYQFHVLCFDKKRISIDDAELKLTDGGVENYTEVVNLEAGRAYKFVVETENASTGAARMIVRWRTPAMFALERQPVVNNKQLRSVYLPDGANWFDFWSGKYYNGGQTIEAYAPIDIMPIYVRAGSIVPLSPLMEYSTQIPLDTLELRIYAGKDAYFELYEDENDNYNYERGEYSIIPMQWNDAKHTLTIKPRQGSFAGMLSRRVFKIVLVDAGVGVGIEPEENPIQTIEYEGDEVSVEIKQSHRR
ncbi:MAG: DUF5110 domain-containing protein [Marinilabiliaceae bacterium]|nr:DUF5110 domain-containing protein [Marinilabiliaceae bacterium]